jgi:hypothetical protein
MVVGPNFVHSGVQESRLTQLRSLRHERAFECREFVFIDIREKRQSVMIKRYIQVEILNLSNLSKFSNLLSN